MDLCLVAAGFSWASPSSWLAILQVVFGLGAVIFVHELGHFLVAKACGVKCEKFYLGFDAFEIKIGDYVIVPRSLLKWQWGETLYGIGILPLGGYVKMLGQDDNPANAARERERSQMGGSESVSSADQVEEMAGPIDRSKLDPRSYQAKSVLQRMAIISAGVIMNLIFAVLFATFAFWTGVRYVPPVIGGTAPGSPAYVANIDGAEVLSIDGQTTQSTYYPFEYLQEAILLNGAVRPIDFVFRLYDQEQPVEMRLTPELGLIPQLSDLAALGIRSESATTLADPPVIPGSAADRAQPPLESGDTIVEVQGLAIHSMRDLRRVVAQHPDQDLALTVTRETKSRSKKPAERITISIPTHDVIDYGIDLKMGPIKAIQERTPAAASSLRVGDQIQTLDGKPLGNPFKLQASLLAAARENRTVTLTVRRWNEEGVEQTENVELRPQLPTTTPWDFDRQTMALSGLGIAIGLTNEIAALEADSPAVEAGFQVGDILTAAHFQLNDEYAQNPLYRGFRTAIDFEEANVGWCDIVEMTQSMRDPQPVKVTLLRGDQSMDLTMTPRLDRQFKLDNRGLSLVPLEREYRAKSLWEATTLGADRTRRDMGRVFKFLGKLVRGEVGVKHLGGPGTIAVAATSEASNGLSRLLLFLTLLSANLAIVNFLPIPVLDGGHMMFLAYEGIFRRPVNERVQIILTYLGLLFILGLMLLVISLDVFRFAF